MHNPLKFELLTDTYKGSHPSLYPPDMTYLESYAEARSKSVFDDICFFGLQTNLKKHFVGQVFGSKDDIDHAYKIYSNHVSEGVYPKAKMIEMAENLVVGSGGGLLRKLNRDDIHFAIKACYTKRGITGINLAKECSTDLTKKSKAGQLGVFYDNGYKTLNLETASAQGLKDNLLREVFFNGELLIDESFQTMRARARS